MGLALETGQELSFILIERYFNMLRDERLELFFSLWQMAHELERRGCLARVFHFEPLETRQDMLERIDMKCQLEEGFYEVYGLIIDI